MASGGVSAGGAGAARLSDLQCEQHHHVTTHKHIFIQDCLCIPGDLQSNHVLSHAAFQGRTGLEPHYSVGYYANSAQETIH
jgi:hypothetical protein